MCNPDEPAGKPAAAKIGCPTLRRSRTVLCRTRAKGNEREAGHVICLIMHKTSVILSLLGLGLTALAADFWKDKAYSQWSDDEVTKMLSSSPWAQSTKASAPNQGMGQRGGGGGSRRGGGGG